MEEAGESSSVSLPWAKLVPIDSRMSDVEIKRGETVVKSAISWSEDESEWCKIVRNLDSSTATMYNLSLGAIVVDGGVIQKGESCHVRCGSEIVPSHHQGGGVTYRFKVMPADDEEGGGSVKVRIAVKVDESKCGICLSVWHDVVTLAPCFHNFCNGCFSEWLKRSKSGRVLCPYCRASVQFAGRNHFLHNIAQDILNADPSLARSSDEIATLNSAATIKSNLVIKSGNRNHRKRSHSRLDDDNTNSNTTVDLPCPQCSTEFNGFRCDQNTIHLQCQACGGMMPTRPHDTVPQHCLGCDRAFCGAYWHAQGVMGVDSYSTCRHESFKPISERTVSRIPFLAHEKNRHEQDITEKCIRHGGRTVEEVVAEWVTKLNNREIDRSRMALNNAETITSETLLCNECYEKLVSFLLYWYRITVPKDVMPREASEREDCWYGFACRTQHHNEQHARRRNHVCRPTRGSSFLT